MEKRRLRRLLLRLRKTRIKEPAALAACDKEICQIYYKKSPCTGYQCRGTFFVCFLPEFTLGRFADRTLVFLWEFFKFIFAAGVFVVAYAANI